MTRPPFLIDAYGLFTPGQVRLEWRDETRPTTPQLDQFIRETWDRQLEWSRRTGGNLFNGKLARYLRHTQSEHALSIEVGPTDYSEFLGTNYLNYNLVEEFGLERYSNPIGTSATMITSDGWLLLGRRNYKVACHAGFVHNFGGSLEPSDRHADGTLDVFASIHRELEEEIGIASSELEELVCVGLIQDPFVRQPELVFDAQVRLSCDEIMRRLAVDDEEHTNLVACADAADAIGPFVRDTDKIAPIAVGSTCLHGRRRFGEAWFQQIMSQLRPPIPPQ